MHIFSCCDSSFQSWTKKASYALRQYSGSNFVIANGVVVHFKDSEFEVTTATTVEEAKQVLTAGFDYVTEKNGIMLFRRPKRFSKYA
jgi:hypothetical protein